MHARLAATLNALQLDVQNVATARFFVHLARQAVERQKDSRNARIAQLLNVAIARSNDQAVRIQLNTPEAHFARHADDVHQVLAARGLATGDLHGAIGSHGICNHLVHSANLVERGIMLIRIGAHEAHRALQVAAGSDLDFDKRAATLMTRARTAPIRARSRGGQRITRRNLWHGAACYPLEVLFFRPNTRSDGAMLGASARHAHNALVIGVDIRLERFQTMRAQRQRVIEMFHEKSPFVQSFNLRSTCSAPRSAASIIGRRTRQASRCIGIGTAMLAEPPRHQASRSAAPPVPLQRQSHRSAALPERQTSAAPTLLQARLPLPLRGNNACHRGYPDTDAGHARRWAAWKW